MAPMQNRYEMFEEAREECASLCDGCDELTEDTVLDSESFGTGPAGRGYCPRCLEELNTWIAGR